LNEIWTFVAKDSLRQADKLVDRLDELIQELAVHPSLGVNRDHLSPDLRAVMMKPYIIYYKAIDQDILIVRILHGARDQRALFSS
jgi:toxin ParE1/3/4